MRHTILTAASLWLAMASAAAAQDLYVYGGIGLAAYPEYDGPGTDTRGDINAYLQVERSGFYLGSFVELSSQSFDDKVDIYAGYRAETEGGLSYDFSGQRRFYFNGDGDYTSFELDLGYSFNDKLSSSLAVTYYPDLSSTFDAYVGLSYAVTDKLSVSANYGVYEVEGASSEQEWDFGAGYALGDETVLDLRYYDGTEYVAGYVGVALNWDTTLFSR